MRGWISDYFNQHLPLILAFTVMFGLGLFLVWGLVLSRIDWFAESNECSQDAPPHPPELVNVVQDPDTLTVTAEVLDQSDNEQWIALERTLITRNNQVVVVGTDVAVDDRFSAPTNDDVGRTVFIDDRGIVENRKPLPGLEYVYTARSWNCLGAAEASNDITILSLFPR